MIYLSTVGHYRAVTLNPRIVGFCRESMNRFDVAQIYGLYDWLGPAAGFFCRRRGVPYVLEPMGMFRPIVRSLALKRLYHGVFGNSLVGGARFLIATSEQERRELIEGGVAASRIVVRRNGIDLPEKIPSRGEFRRQFDIPEDARVVLFLGRVVSKKSPDLLLDAFSRWHGKPGNENSRSGDSRSRRRRRLSSSAQDDGSAAESGRRVFASSDRSTRLRNGRLIATPMFLCFPRKTKILAIRRANPPLAARR